MTLNEERHLAQRDTEVELTSANFLLRVIHFAEDVVRGCNAHCLVCNDNLSFAGKEECLLAARARSARGVG